MVLDMGEISQIAFHLGRKLMLLFFLNFWVVGQVEIEYVLEKANLDECMDEEFGLAAY